MWNSRLIVVIDTSIAICKHWQLELLSSDIKHILLNRDTPLLESRIIGEFGNQFQDLLFSLFCCINFILL